MECKVSVVYFSPTENTKKTLKAMAEEIGNNVEEFDLTCPKEDQRVQFGKDDFVIFGAPVYGGRIPEVARERLEDINGENTPCLVVVSFGNRDYDDALLELSDLVKKHGFVVKGAAAVVGRHTYGEIQTERPDEADLNQDREFAAAAAKKPEDALELVIPGNTPYKEGGKGGKFRPQTSEACVKCGLCVKKCPVQAIGADCVTISDSCIACFRCIRKCPVQAKNMDTEEYQAFAKLFTEKLRERKENEFFL